jgi:hypothetical protein
MLHSSYSFALAFDAELVGEFLNRLDVDEKSLILDPFCGTGTTLLESKLRHVRAVGIDANPVCVIASKGKTDWHVNPRDVREFMARSLLRASKFYNTYRSRVHSAQKCKKKHWVISDPLFVKSAAGMYLRESGLLRRGWISPRPALKTLLLAQELWEVSLPARNFLLLSLFGLLVPEISNMGYGPEIFRKRVRRDRDVFGIFRRRVEQNLEKLEYLQSNFQPCQTIVKLGDSSGSVFNDFRRRSVTTVITSPPYLSDHDYSRLTRLELVFSGHVRSRRDLRLLKTRLLRSSSKNVYSADCLGELVKDIPSVASVTRAISREAGGRGSGFARVYPRLIGEYFGGIYRHFQRISPALRRGARCAYVVGDQSSFFGIPIPTARIVGELAERCGAGLRVTGLEPLRDLRGTRGVVTWRNTEWALFLRKA